MIAIDILTWGRQILSFVWGFYIGHLINKVYWKEKIMPTELIIAIGGCVGLIVLTVWAVIMGSK